MDDEKKITMAELLAELERFPGDLLVQQVKLTMKTDRGTTVSYAIGEPGKVFRSGPMSERDD